MLTFKDQLRSLRRMKRATQEDAAEALGVTRAALAGWETGRGHPEDYETLGRVADYYGVTVDYLIGHSTRPEGEPPPIAPVVASMVVASSDEPAALHRIVVDIEVRVTARQHEELAG